MSFIHKETFDIIDNSNIDGDLDQYFECDEAIALPIQELNRKGYITEYCCSGHAFPNHIELRLLSKCDNPLSVVEGAYKYEELEDDTVRVTALSPSVRQGYIAFTPNTPLPPSIPDKWEYEDERVMRCYYNEKCTEFEFLMTVPYAMSLLYEWACSLPPAPHMDDYMRLTPGDRIAYDLRCQGKTYAEIARKQGYSTTMARTHANHAKHKLEVYAQKRKELAEMPSHCDLSQFTETELKVHSEHVLGKMLKDIATELSISPETASKIFQKVSRATNIGVRITSQIDT